MQEYYTVREFDISVKVFTETIYNAMNYWLISDTNCSKSTQSQNVQYFGYPFCHSMDVWNSVLIIYHHKKEYRNIDLPGKYTNILKKASGYLACEGT